MNIYEGEIKSTKEMREFFGVNEDQWKKQKNKLLEHFSKFYEYEVKYSGRNINYHIIKKLAEYEPIPKKKDKNDQLYESGIIRVIEEDNLQTAANVARILAIEDETIKKLHKESTIYEYTRVRMRNMFGTAINEGGTRGMIEEKRWCKLIKADNVYEEMSQEHIDAFLLLFSKMRDCGKEDDLEILNDFHCGLISQAEMCKRIGYNSYMNYSTAKKMFADTYGYIPIKVPLYQLSAFDEVV